MLINTNILPFDIETNIIKSDIWCNSTLEERREFISNATTFTTIFKYYIKSYKSKQNYKGYFVAAMLENFYYDYFELATKENGTNGINRFDEELALYPDLNSYSGALLRKSLDLKKYIKKIKHMFEVHKSNLENEISKHDETESLEEIFDKIAEDFGNLLFQPLRKSF